MSGILQRRTWRRVVGLAFMVGGLTVGGLCGRANAQAKAGAAAVL